MRLPPTMRRDRHLFGRFETPEQPETKFSASKIG
jgi:hypothetical protein